MPEPPPIIIDAILAFITVVVTIGTAVSITNRNLLIKLNDSVANLDGRTKVLEDWRVNHEHWKETQINDLKSHLNALESRRPNWDGAERRRRPRREDAEE